MVVVDRCGKAKQPVDRVANDVSTAERSEYPKIPSRLLIEPHCVRFDAVMLLQEKLLQIVNLLDMHTRFPASKHQDLRQRTRPPRLWKVS